MKKRQAKERLFSAPTPLGFSVYVNHSRWHLISSVKHPTLAGCEKDIKDTLQKPEQIRYSKTDSSVYLFYKAQRKGRWLCAVSKKINGEGFLITAYPTDSIKVGEKIWPK